MQSLASSFLLSGGPLPSDHIGLTDEQLSVQRWEQRERSGKLVARGGEDAGASGGGRSWMSSSATEIVHSTLHEDDPLKQSLRKAPRSSLRRSGSYGSQSTVVNGLGDRVRSDDGVFINVDPIAASAHICGSAPAMISISSEDYHGDFDENMDPCVESGGNPQSSTFDPILASRAFGTVSTSFGHRSHHHHQQFNNSQQDRLSRRREQNSEKPTGTVGRLLVDGKFSVDTDRFALGVDSEYNAAIRAIHEENDRASRAMWRATANSPDVKSDATTEIDTPCFAHLPVDGGQRQRGFHEDGGRVNCDHQPAPCLNGNNPARSAPPPESGFVQGLARRCGISAGEGSYDDGLFIDNKKNTHGAGSCESGGASARGKITEAGAFLQGKVNQSSCRVSKQMRFLQLH